MALCGFLKEDTADDILLGPMIDDTDGKTAETGLTLDVELSKNGQALANKNDATAPVHDAAGTVDGYYNCELDATDTNTPGILTVVAHAAGFLPVRQDYQVLSANVYDSLFGAAAADLLDVNVGQISTDATAADNAELMFDGTGYAGGTIKLGVDEVAISGDATAADNLEKACDGTTYNIGGGAVVAASVTGAVGSVTGAVGSVTGAVGSVTGAVGSVTGAVGSVTGAVGSVTGGVTVTTNNDKTGYALADATSDAVIADAVWNAATASYGGAGSYGLVVETNCDAPISTVDTVVDAILVDTAVIGALGAGLTALATQTSLDAVKTDTAAILVDTGTTLDDLIDTEIGTIITDIAAVKADTAAILIDTAVIGALGAGLTALATQASVTAIDDLVDTEVGAIKGVTDKLDSALVLDGAVYQFTANALELAPTGGSAPTVAQIADGVWDEAIADHAGAGSTGLALAGAGDPWNTAIPGAYAAGTAGKKVADLYQATVGNREIKNNQEIMYDADGTTPLFTYNLTQDGTPTEFNPDRRIVV